MSSSHASETKLPSYPCHGQFATTVSTCHRDLSYLTTAEAYGDDGLESCGFTLLFTGGRGQVHRGTLLSRLPWDGIRGVLALNTPTDLFVVSLSIGPCRLIADSCIEAAEYHIEPKSSHLRECIVAIEPRSFRREPPVLRYMGPPCSWLIPNAVGCLVFGPSATRLFAPGQPGMWMERPSLSGRSCLLLLHLLPRHPHDDELSTNARRSIQISLMILFSGSGYSPS